MPSVVKQTEHNTPDSTHLCPYCPSSNIGSQFKSYVFASKADRHRHLVIFHEHRKRAAKRQQRNAKRGRVTKTRIHQCKVCGAQFNSFHFLAKHKKLIHPGADARKRVAPIADLKRPAPCDPQTIPEHISSTEQNETKVCVAGGTKAIKQEGTATCFFAPKHNNAA